MNRRQASDELCELLGCVPIPDDGAWSHRLTCPRHHAATCANCRELGTLRQELAATDCGIAGWQRGKDHT